MAGNPERSDYTVKLIDETSGPARSAAAALVDLRQKIEGDTRSLRDMQAAMSRLRGATTPNTEALREMRDRIAAQKNVIAQAQAQYNALGGTFGATKKEATTLAEGFGELLDTSSAVPGPLGAISGRLSSIMTRLGPVGTGAVLIAGGFLAIVAASAALVGALATATAALLRYSVAQADARRAEQLHFEGLGAMRRMFGRVTASSAEMQAAIDGVTDRWALGRGEGSRYAEQLARMGLRGAALSEALDAVAIGASVGGDAMAQRFAGLAAGAARSGRSVSQLASHLRATFGPIAERQALGFDRQMQRLRESVSQLFAGLRIEVLLRALRSVTSLFSQSTATGRALRQLVEVLFQPLLDRLAGSGPLVRRFFQGMVIGAQRLTIMVLRLRNWFLRTFGGSDILGAIDTQRIALNAGVVAVTGLAAAVLIAVGVLAAFVGILGLAAASVAMLLGPVVVAAGAVAGLAAAWYVAGQQLVDGLVNGLVRGRDRVVAAVRGLAGIATSTLRDVLQIRSPSRVFAELGAQIPAGLADGVEGGAGAADSAVAAMVEPPPVAGARGGERVAVSIGDVHVHLASAEPAPRELGRAIVDEIVRALEGVGVEIGAPA